jgi:uncharacterized membrane protein
LSLALLVHLLGVVVWVGGMFFAYMALRPVAAAVLEPPLRLSLWAGVFGKFFPWVWLSIALILGSGLYMWMGLGGASAPLYVVAMMVLGVVMMLIFAHVFFAAFKKLKRAVAEQAWPAGGAALAQIRMLIGINLSIGLITVVVAILGRALA